MSMIVKSLRVTNNVQSAIPCVYGDWFFNAVVYVWQALIKLIIYFQRKSIRSLNTYMYRNMPVLQ